MRNILIEVEYDGTNYCGWQIQPNGKTIQEEIMKVLENLTGSSIIVHGSGRTDSKVHAKGQNASFQLQSSIPTPRLPLVMNSLLPMDISVKKAIEVPMEFHARYSAIGKRYVYQIHRGEHRSPLLRNYAYHFSRKLDMDKIIKGKELFVGTHDFKGFMSSGSSTVDTVRTIHSIEIEEKGDCLWISFEGNGFLYNMVRIMVGTLIELGTYKKSEEDIIKAIKEGNRNFAGHKAPPQGLYLDKVFYPLTH
ncbi:tRNA pseudouridine(38-40) synthase TruA [Alkaliphilus hydrothermalis]|uniref:tRNA pseudouridine synthase A n=1 Tax=Alkaliphilus hydrothermalis TaxID=1482730 RepID=A0ABS2NQP3_9FIRM|nr:tRNA pseudouridine(38-40) synthase TruA [Alkaliphilus hydrothermalis]MBM7615269.1 tRNA pseudouridine38-40 synthase [Alkaliphilus hydrothermalis]